MIIEPDFLTHWKTQMLITEMADKAAPLYLIALWAHCQQRRTVTFSNLAPTALKAICRYEGEASKLRSALERCGFLAVEGEATVVRGWAEYNAKLVANWGNGQLGGRPKKSGKTQRKPKRNPTSKSANPNETDRSREDEMRKDEMGEDQTKGAAAPLNPRSSFHEAFEKFWKAYPAIRRQKKALAYKAWQVAGKRLVVERKVSKSEAVNILQLACEEFAASPVAKGDYCPGPAPWLTQGCYDDDRTSWQQTGETKNGKSTSDRVGPGQRYSGPPQPDAPKRNQ